jgi:hypothetical protein
MNIVALIFLLLPVLFFYFLFLMFFCLEHERSVLYSVPSRLGRTLVATHTRRRRVFSFRDSQSQKAANVRLKPFEIGAFEKYLGIGG